jgi:hypothetical protein
MCVGEFTEVCTWFTQYNIPVVIGFRSDKVKAGGCSFADNISAAN